MKWIVTLGLTEEELLMVKLPALKRNKGQDRSTCFCLLTSSHNTVGVQN